jgi:hypothetical protein
MARDDVPSAAAVSCDSCGEPLSTSWRRALTVTIAAIALGFALACRVWADDATAASSLVNPILAFTSDVNDDLGTGGPQTFTDADGRFEATSFGSTFDAGGGVIVTYSSHALSSVFSPDVDPNDPAVYWQVRFAAPIGSELAPGVYDNAVIPRRAGAAEISVVGHDAAGHGGSCDVIQGRFVVSELVNSSASDDNAGDVQQLAVDFELHCDNDTAVFSGYVRINSPLPPLPPTAIPPPPTPSAHSPIFAYTSDPGNFVGGSQRRTYTDADGVFATHHEPGLVAIDFAHHLLQGVQWSLYFQAPEGSELLPGFYPDASNAGFPRKPGIDVIGTYTCFEVGDFIVSDAVYAPNGDVERFAADFELHCDNGNPLLFGYVRINSDVPPPPPRTPTPTPRPDQFILRLDGDPDALVGGGRHVTLTAASRWFSGMYGLYDYVPDVELQLSGDLEDWDLIFAPPLCDGLVPGTFDGATQWPFAIGAAPVMNVMGNHRSCADGLTGSFTIHDAQYDADGWLYRFDADFDQRCLSVPDVPSGTLHGSVSFTSMRPTPTPPAPTPTPSDYSSVAVLYSEFGDYIGLCQSQYLTLADGDFTATFQTAVFDHIADQLAVFFNDGPDSWQFRFQSPDGQKLVPGTYRDAGEWDSKKPSDPGFGITWQDRACDSVMGQFTVYEIEVQEDEVVRFAADFVQHCDDVEPPLYGAIRYHSTLPPPTPAVGRASIPTPALGPCWGDCSGDGKVSVNELIIAVQLALGASPVERCPQVDADHDGKVTVDELIAAVGVALSGCNPSSTGSNPDPLPSAAS